MRSKLVMVVLFFLSSLSGCGNVVPPGTVVIKLSAGGETEIYKQGVYKKWGRDRVYFVDTKLKSFTEKMEILCEDKVNLSVDVKWIGSFRVDKKYIDVIKDKVPAKEINTGDLEGYQLSLDEFYKTAVKDIIRGYSRQVISPYVTEAVNKNRIKVEADLKKKILERLAALNYPVQTTDVLLSNLDFDNVIKQQRSSIKKSELEDEKSAALAKASLAQAKRDEDIARAKGKATVAKAQADAAANNILSNSITPAILAMRQWEVLSEAAAGPNNELIIVPFEAIQTNMMSNAINRRSLRGTSNTKKVGH